MKYLLLFLISTNCFAGDTLWSVIEEHKEILELQPAYDYYGVNELDILNAVEIGLESLDEQ